MKPRVTILGIMAVVALVATALVALRSTLEIWASAYFSLTLALLCTAIPGMAYRRRRASGLLDRICRVRVAVPYPLLRASAGHIV